MHDYPAPPPQAFHVSFGLASIIKLPTHPKEKVAYKDLVCTKQDKMNIIESVAAKIRFDFISILPYMPVQ
jgi:hypothetical protein